MMSGVARCRQLGIQTPNFMRASVSRRRAVVKPVALGFHLRAEMAERLPHRAPLALLRVKIHHCPPSFTESSLAVADSSRASRSTPISLTCSVSPTATTTWLTRSEPAPTGAAMTVIPLM